MNKKSTLDWEKIRNQVEAFDFMAPNETIEETIISNFDSNRRAYITPRFVVKVSGLELKSVDYSRSLTLKNEHQTLEKLHGLFVVPVAKKFIQAKDFQCLVLNRFDGIELGAATINAFKRVLVLWKVFYGLVRISFRGISHNDICPRNILISNTGEIKIIDFDQSSNHSVGIAFLNSIFGLEIQGAKSHFSFMRLLKKSLKYLLPQKVIKVYRAMVGKNYREDVIEQLPMLPNGASEELKKVYSAWKIAQQSDASSPGFNYAYFSYVYDGIRFPGERSWQVRWEKLQSLSDYSGKRILELGCNMGLLGAYLIKEKEAESVLGIDNDPKIIEAAKLLDSVFDVRVERQVVDLNSPENWEDALEDFKPDIVFVLNVLNWVNDPMRLLTFLGRFSEVIFEGHDIREVESKRFEAVGFNDIKYVGLSERNRPIFIFRK